MAQFFEFTPSGIKFTGFQNVRQSLKDAWETTFGVQLDDSPTSPDGHHIDLETKTVNSVLEAVQVVTTMMNRKQAVGQFLDILAVFVGLERNDGESDESLRKRMDAADMSGMATFDGMLTYLRDEIHQSVDMKQNDEPTTDSKGLPGHSFRVYVPQDVYDELEDREDDDDTFDADDFIAQKIWNCKPAGIKADGNMTGHATDKSGTQQDVNFSIPQDVKIEVSVTLSLYDEEVFPDDGTDAVEKAIEGWATGTDGWDSAAFTPDKDVLPARFYRPILTVPGIASAVIQVRKAGESTWSGDAISIGSQEVAKLTSVEVEVAQS